MNRLPGQGAPLHYRVLVDLLVIGGSGLLGRRITRQALLAGHNVIATFHQLRRIGVKLAIDDFGTGYSSLSYLKRFPVDYVKIDQTFIRDLSAGGEDAAITRAIIAMAHSLELKVVAEGVENHEQLSFLRSQRCDEIRSAATGCGTEYQTSTYSSFDHISRYAFATSSRRREETTPNHGSSGPSSTP